MKYSILLFFLILPLFPAFSNGNSEQNQSVLLPAPGSPPAGAEQEFSTDFSKSLIPLETILSGGPPKDGIPPIDDPVYYSLRQADSELSPAEPVMLLQSNEESRIYPLRILMWHEIVNDELGGVPVTVTYCPLCNTGIAFGRETSHGILDFGTTGRLRYSNLLMYDRQTESWWQQATGEAVIGELAGNRLKMLPVRMLSFGTASEIAPRASVLSPETGYSRPYGRNPYTGYDSADEPFLYTGPRPADDFNPLDRILAVEAPDGTLVSAAYSELAEKTVIMFGRSGVVVFLEQNTASALDSSRIEDGRNVGSALAYRSSAAGKKLSFNFDDGNIIDDQTGSIWTPAGLAVDGPLKGEMLEPLVAVNHFWFSYNAFFGRD